MTHKPLKILLKSEQDTANLAHRLSRHLAPGDVVLLIGEIGAGKSFFARSIIQFSQDIAEDVLHKIMDELQTTKLKRINNIVSVSQTITTKTDPEVTQYIKNITK